MAANVINVFNFKGGVGKTTCSTIFSWLLSVKQHKRTLLIDFDPQSNATEIINETYPKFDPDSAVPILKGMKNLDLTKSIVKANNCLDVIPATWQLSLLPDLLRHYGEVQQHFLLSELLKNIKNNYDYILIDTPPTLSEYTNNAILASDYVIIVMQTQQQCYSSSIKSVGYLQQLKHDFSNITEQDYNHDVSFLGLIPYLVKRNGKVDTDTLKKAKDRFGLAMYKNKIAQRERVKLFGEEGIRDKDNWDRDAINMYNSVLSETIKRIKE